MVKDIVFAATNGKRNASNYPEGMWLIEIIAKYNYKHVIREWWDAVNNGTDTPGHVFYKMYDSTYINTSGVNGMTQTSQAVMRAYHRLA